MIRFGSVCSGIEAASAAWTPLGWECAWVSEIDPFANAVLRHHYPEVPNRGDFTAIQATSGGPIDLLVGGTPCQDFSVAGLRAGITGERGNLTLEFLALVRRLRPRYVVWENVPGFLSIDDGAVFHWFLDELEDAGYVTDVDVLDAQHFGVPQRRRRVFVCGQRADHLMSARTISSALTIAQCLSELLVLSLAAQRRQSVTGLSDLDFDAGQPGLSLKRRMTLFGLEADDAVQTLLASLAVLHQSCGCGRDDSASPHGRTSPEDSATTTATKSSASSAVQASPPVECRCIGPSWSGILADCLRTASESTTSTLENETTESRIFTCSRLMLGIAELITPSLAWSPSYWSAASSLSTALKVFTNYARSASSSLFTPVDWILPWLDFIGQAERADLALGYSRDGRGADPLLPVGDSLSGHPAPREEAREDVADPVTTRVDRGGSHREARGAGLAVAGGQTARYGKGPDSDLTDALVTHSLRADGFDAGEDGTGRGTPPAACRDPIAFITARQIRDSDSANEWGVKAGTISDSLSGDGPGAIASFDSTWSGDFGIEHGDVSVPMKDGHGTVPAVGFTQNSRSEVRLIGGDGDSVGAVTAEPGAQQQNYVAGPMAVRRLTPVECERLQGLPDGYTAVPYRGKPAADGNRYKALGNSFAVPVVRWIGRRIQMVEEVRG